MSIELPVSTSGLLFQAEDAVKRYAGQLHIGAQATDPEQVKAKKEDDFFGNFENSEMKQEAQIEAPASRLVAAESKPAAPEPNNDNVDKLTVNLSATKLTKAPVKTAKVTFALLVIYYDSFMFSWVLRKWVKRVHLVPKKWQAQHSRHLQLLRRGKRKK